MMLGNGPISGAPLSSLWPLSLPDLPAVLLQALLVRGARTDDGHIIEAITPAWHAVVSILATDPQSMFTIPPEKWEEIVAGFYERAGFDEVILTPRSGDLGRDVIASKSGLGEVRLVDQVKAYKPGHLVTAEEVRALGFVMLADKGTSKGVVTTTSCL